MHPAVLILALATGAFGAVFKERQAASTAVTTVHTIVTETVYCTTTATHTSIRSAQLSSTSPSSIPTPVIYSQPTTVVTPSSTKSAILSTPTSCTPSVPVYSYSVPASSSASPILQSTSSVSVPVYSPPPVYTPPPVVHTSKATVAPVLTSTVSAYTGGAASNYAAAAPLAGALAAGLVAVLV